MARSHWVTKAASEAGGIRGLADSPPGLGLKPTRFDERDENQLRIPPPPGLGSKPAPS